MTETQAAAVVTDGSAAPPSALVAIDISVVVEAWAAGRPVAEIATALGIPVERVESLLLATFFDFE